MILNIPERTVAAGDGVAKLTRSQVALMAAITHAEPVSMDRLMHAIWGYDGPEMAPQVVRVMIYHLRKKFHAAGFGATIDRVWGRGYKLNRPMRIIYAAGGPVLIPGEHRVALERLLFSHPDREAADLVIESFGRIV